MNNGLLGWPQARATQHPSLLGFPPNRRMYRHAVVPDLAGAAGTNQIGGVGGSSTDYYGNLPANLAVSDLMLATCRFTASAANTTSPADWTTIHTGNNTGGYWSAWKYADATDVTGGVMQNPIVRVATDDQANFLIVRFPTAGTPTLGTAQTGNGSTPVMNGVTNTAAMGDIHACGVSIGSCENSRSLSDWVGPTLVSGRSGVWSDLLTQVNGSQVSFMAFLLNESNGPFSGWGSWQSGATWTNFNIAPVWIPPLRARASWQR